MHIFNELSHINKSSLALGFFDGLHLGHKVVIKNAVNVAKLNDTKSCIITFKEHPSTVLSQNTMYMILTLDERLEIFEKLGIDNVFLLDFNSLSHISANDYLDKILYKYFSPIAITTGFNHNFGYNKTGNDDLLRACQGKYGYKYYEVPPFVVENEIVSCSTIRNKLSIGDFYTANKLLGYNFFIQGCVIEGDKIASKLGFPSANIVYPEDKIKIPNGVYYVIVQINGKEYNGVLNYGYSPTVNNEKIKTEVHIIDFNENIYGKNIKISFITKIRNQMKFSSPDKLKYQLQRDVAFTEIYKHFINGNMNFFGKKLYL